MSTLTGVDLPEGFESVPISGSDHATKDTFYYEQTPVITQEGRVRMATTAWSRRIARGTFAQFIREFFDGRFKDRLSVLAPGTAVNFTSVPGESLDTDADKRFIQIAKKVAQLYQKLPCILVADTGETVIPPGLGYYDRNEQVNGNEIRTRSRVYQVPLEIIVASRDEDSADELAEVVGIIIENRNVVGSLIQGTNFEVRLPIQYSPGSRVTQPYPDDPTNIFSMVSITAEVGVEIWWYEQSPILDPACLITGHPSMVGSGFDQRKVIYPPKVKLRDRSTIQLVGYPAGTTIFSRDYNILLVDENFKILPVQVGKTKIVIKGPREGPPVDELPIEVIL